MTGKIYVTGDMHRRFTRFNVARFPLQKKLDKESKVHPLSEEEARENSKLLTYLATHWGK